MFNEPAIRLLFFYEGGETRQLVFDLVMTVFCHKDFSAENFVLIGLQKGRCLAKFKPKSQ